MKIAPISAASCTEPLPRITNDMLPRVTTLPPALVLLLWMASVTSLSDRL